MPREPLCPDPVGWRICRIAPEDDRIVLHLEPLRTTVACPVCGTDSRRVHSHYRRQPWDLPWGRWPVQLVVHARRFFCDAPGCPRRIFVESFPGVLAPYARQTERWRQALLALAHASSAETAARVAWLLGYRTSPDTLIRRQRLEPFICAAPRVLGIDEFALRRGATYATLLVDLERHRPVAVLEGRTAEPLMKWLQMNPPIAILVRDRADAYAAAGRQAAPEAMQVADRFHLIRNVSDALKRLVHSRRWQPPRPKEASATAMPDPPAAAPPAPEAHPKAPRPTPRKWAIWEDIQQRQAAGQSIRYIARALRMDRKTVRKYVTAERPPVYPRRRPRPTQLTPHLTYLQERWRQGCHNAHQLYQELRRRGYRGAISQVRALVHPWRTAPEGPSPRPPSLPWLVLRPASQLTEAEQQALQSFLRAHPLLAGAYQLKERFQALVANRDVTALDQWLHDAEASGVPVFQRLAQSFRQDYAPISAALTTPWSTGQCEGQICRVKLLKRLGYGRAKLDLLRQRILHRTAVPWLSIKPRDTAQQQAVA